MENILRVGFADRIITPTESVPLAGYGAGKGTTSHRMSQRILEDLHAIAVAISDQDGNTVLFMTMDTTRAYFEVTPEARERISRETGIPVERIILACTHTHAGPDLLNDEVPSIVRYRPVLQDHLSQAAQDALADRKPARISVGNIDVTGMSFVRHYKYTDTDGTEKFFGANFGTATLNETTRHATEAYTPMHLIRFQREGGKDVVLANWRAHATMTGGGKKYDMSADYPAPFRSVLSAQMDCHVIYLQGAAGNISPTSRIESENYTKDHNVYGARLAYFAVKCLENNMRPVPAGRIQTRQSNFAGKINHLQDHLVPQAQKIAELFRTTKDAAACREAGKPFGIASPYHATSIISKSAMGESLELELDAITIGDQIAFVTAPNELFDTNSRYTEENSPFPMTFTCGYANGHWFYIPSEGGYAYGCYESHVSRFGPGTAEEISEEFLAMLRQLRENT